MPSVTAVWWFGGKGHLASWLISLLPTHTTYVEPFGGGAAVLLNKSPSPVEIHNDVDEGLVHFWRVVRDPVKYLELQRRLALTPYARAEWGWSRDTWRETEDPVERAARWYTVARQSFSGNFGGGWSYSTTLSRRGMGSHNSAWLSSIECLPEIHARMMRVQIDCDDWRKVLERYDTPETFFYCDPPYVPKTRRDGEYKHEMTTEDHEELVGRLLLLQGKVLLSGYPSDSYLPLEDAGWNRLERDVSCYAAGKTRGTGLLGNGVCKENQRRTEVVWINYQSSNKQPELKVRESSLGLNELASQ